MATTLIENIVNELTTVVVQSVMKEFQAQEMRLTVLEKEFETLSRRVDLDGGFVTRDDLLVDEALINDRLVAMENILAAQPLVDTNFVDERVKTWVRRHLNQEIDDALERTDIYYKIQRALEDTDFEFDDSIKEAVYERVDDELKARGFLDEEDLQRYLDQQRFITEGSLVEFINDRVRITVE